MHHERIRTPASSSSNWRSRGACRAHDPELFFPDGDEPQALVQAGTAKAVCQSCPVAGACLAWALSIRQSFGVWGGLTHEERRAVLGVRAFTALTARATAQNPTSNQGSAHVARPREAELVGGGRHV